MAGNELRGLRFRASNSGTFGEAGADRTRAVQDCGRVKDVFSLPLSVGIQLNRGKPSADWLELSSCLFLEEILGNAMSGREAHFSFAYPENDTNDDALRARSS